MKTLHPPSKDHFQQIYSGKNITRYDQLVKFEDAENNLLRTFQQHTSLKGSRLLDVGTGTGRIARLVDEYVSQVVALDLNLPMLRIARRRNRKNGDTLWVAAADVINLPVPDAWADIAIAGWALGHFCDWFANWENLIDNAVREMQRTIKPGGTQIIIETMGTGLPTPMPTTDSLEAYYMRLETIHGFNRKIIRTDYEFPSVETAVELVDFFFGADLAQEVRMINSATLIEWTGVWWRRV